MSLREDVVNQKEVRLNEHMRKLTIVKINKEVSEKLGVIARDLNSFVKELGLPKSTEIELQTEFIEMLFNGCTEFHDKMLNRIPIETPPKG